jgi:hypothetical protein
MWDLFSAIAFNVDEGCNEHGRNCARDVGVGQPLGRAVVALETRWKASHMDCGTQANLYQRRTFIHLSVCKFQNRCNERPLSAEVAIFLNGSDGQSFRGTSVFYGTHRASPP